MSTSVADIDTLPVLDQSRLVEEFGGDEEILAELAELFLQHVPPLLDEIKAACEVGDAALIARNAHCLKGAAATYGALRLSEIGRRVEMMGKSGDLAGIGPGVEALEEELAQVVEAIGRIRG